MSAPGCWLNVRSCTSGAQLPPGCLPTRVSAAWLSGHTRNRSALEVSTWPSSNTSRGGRLKSMNTSVAVTARHLPARIAIGTPSQRQVSAASRTPAKVSVFDPAATPSTARYPSYCPLTTSAGVSGRSAPISRALDEIHESIPDPSGGSASTVASTWSMWFWMTSLIAPVLS